MPANSLAMLSFTKRGMSAGIFSPGAFGGNTSRKWRKSNSRASSRNSRYEASVARSKAASLLSVIEYKPSFTGGCRSVNGRPLSVSIASSSSAVRNGSDGCRPYAACPPASQMSVVSFARMAGVTGLSSNSRSRTATTSLVPTLISMMSTSCCRTISRICSR